jgi:predicted DNA-binding protein (MmcQ/YjbR family)
MDAERMRAMLLKLPHVAETEAWSTYVLFWAADKSIGGKLFAMMNPVNETNGVITYAAGPERYAELLEREGVSPSVEFPRSQWVQVERWDVFRQAEWQSEWRRRTRSSRRSCRNGRAMCLRCRPASASG